ncbi:uncharacterized protein PGTG_21180 [Puccinia graminis f. sp. tritici CRL 75-36-700-3]|uniref:Uncharacterized protein n=1 Tax=Puccinia graminis f. sp. tritici (strain CRL 75-36-700-3 / race SCCL) TaxID=418459 RepID=H6QQH2_PUCGT|nr:uncharacterized protein PGTG_21180 [Puccinia graminis f. sp. tritici CRL 75-36-700-3]EHS62672.1 hypothetical protein PGTG_21180 [Puccinia graminis f. sp. tritici CRL 75-36-700-3]
MRPQCCSTNNWRPRQSARRKSLSSTASVNYRPSITPKFMSGLNQVLVTNFTAKSTNPAESFPTSDPANKPTIQNPLSSNPASRPPSPLISSQSDRSSVLPPPALPLSTETAGNTSPLPITVTGLSSLRLAAGPPSVLQENSSPSRSRSLDRFPLDAYAKVPKAEYASVTRSPSSVIAIVAEPPASSSIDVVSSSEIIVTTEDPTLTSSLLDPLTQAATLDTPDSNKPIIEPSSRGATQIYHPINIVAPTPSSLIDSSPDLMPSTATPTSSNSNNHQLATTTISNTDKITGPTLPSPLNPKTDLTNNCSSPIQPTMQACTEGLEATEVGPLAFENEESVSMDTQIAPEYSSSTLEYYKDIDNYLETSGVNEIKKKKKKKKKTKNSGSNSSLPSPPLFLPTAAVGSLTVMDENAVAALERQNDPRYRPIEDSEFVPFEDW